MTFAVGSLQKVQICVEVFLTIRNWWSISTTLSNGQIDFCIIFYFETLITALIVEVLMLRTIPIVRYLFFLFFLTFWPKLWTWSLKSIAIEFLLDKILYYIIQFREITPCLRKISKIIFWNFRNPIYKSYVDIGVLSLTYLFGFNDDATNIVNLSPTATEQENTIDYSPLKIFSMRT